MTKTNNSVVGERLRFLRKEILRCTQAELAKTMGVSQSMIPMQEKGLRRPSQDYLINLQKILGVSPSWVLSGEGEAVPYSPTASEASLVRDRNITFSDKKGSTAAGKLLLAPAVPDLDITGRFGYLTLTGTKLRMHAARDAKLEGTNLIRIIEDDVIWAAVGEPSGLELETLREYLEYGEDRSLPEWMECFRFLRWGHVCLKRMASMGVLQLVPRA